MRLFLLLTLVITLNGIYTLLDNLPKAVGDDVPEGKLNSLSFAPFREGQSPLEAIFPSASQIEEDIRLLSTKTNTIRTYASGETMVHIPALAQKYGLKMIQGAWLGYLEIDNRKEIEALVAAANTYPDVIKRVIVGNEILLRGEMEPEKLISYIREVKRAVKQPVSYADVWSMYMKYPELIKEVDFITIHILPYWEDEPIRVDKAPEHIERIYKQVQKEADSISPGKAILIGESGWPSAGKQRGWAVPSVVNEAKFIRSLIKVAQANHFDYNIVEAFNQSWKSELEGIVGANWGLFSVDRQQVFPLTGKVYENLNWFNEYLYSALLLALVCLVCRNKLHKLSVLPLTVFLAFAQLLTVLWISHSYQSWHTSYTDWQRLQVIVMSAFNILLAGLILLRAYSLLAQQSLSKTVAIATRIAYITVAILAIYITYELAFNGRYISFPFSLASMAVAGIWGLGGIRYLMQRHSLCQAAEFNGLIGHHPIKPITNKVLGYGLVLMTVLLIIGEIRAFMVGRDFILAYPELGLRLYQAFLFTLTNRQLLVWLFCLLTLAIPFLLSNCKKTNKGAV